MTEIPEDWIKKLEENEPKKFSDEKRMAIEKMIIQYSGEYSLASIARAAGVSPSQVQHMAATMRDNGRL